MPFIQEDDVVFHCVLAGDVESLHRHCESVVDASGEESQERDLFRYKDEVGRNAMFVACMLGRSHVVKELVKHGAQVNQLSTRGYGPLHCAACWGHLETVMTLLELGADIQAENFRGERPLEVAKRYSHTACADCLMVAGSGAEISDLICVMKKMTKQMMLINSHKQKRLGNIMGDIFLKAKRDLVFYINYIRDIISDPEKIQGKLNKEDKNLCLNACSTKSDWIQHAKNPTVTDFTGQRKHMEDTLQAVLSKLSAAVGCPAKAPKKV